MRLLNQESFNLQGTEWAKRFILYLFVLPIALLWVGCGKMETRVEHGYREGIFWVGNGGEPRNLDLHTVTGLPEFNIIRALFEGLVELDSETLKPVPAGALSWEVLENSRVFRFQLNPAARWSNGDPVTAEDYRFSYQRLLSPALGAQYASELYLLKNAKAYNLGELEDFSQVGVRVLDTHTLELELDTTTPADYFLRLMAHDIWSPVHPATILKFGRIDERDTRWTRPGNMVSNGAFVLKDWNVNSHITVVKNPSYRDADSIKLNEIRFIPISNSQTEERLFRTGMLHVTNGILPSRLEYYRNERPESLRVDPWFGTYYLVINTRVPPLDKPEFRRALSMAIHRENIVRQIVRGNQQPAYSFVPPGLPGWPEKNWFSYHPEEARNLLETIDVSAATLPANIRYLFNTQEVNTAVAEAITRMWQEQLGLNIPTTNQEWKVYLESRRNRNYQILRASWIGDYPDPVTFLGLWTSDSTNNTTGWSHPEYDQLLKQAAQTTDPNQRYALLSQAEQILMEEMPVIPLYFLNRTYLLDPNVTGWPSNLLDRRPWSKVSFRQLD